MNGTNLVFLRGNLGADPETRYTPNNIAVTNLRVATSERRKKGDGYEDHTEWHRVTLFRQPAEFVAANGRKGDPIEIIGSLQTRKWQDQNGNDRWTTEVVVGGYMARATLLKSRNEADEDPGRNRTSGTTGGPKKAAPPDQDFDDDIPF